MLEAIKAGLKIHFFTVNGRTYWTATRPTDKHVVIDTSVLGIPRGEGISLG